MSRDLTAHDASLAQVNTTAAEWSDKANLSDTARDAFDTAKAALEAALAAEASAREAYEQAQTTYTQAYGAVPKEDTLAP